jgi:hypothetical protein
MISLPDINYKNFCVCLGYIKNARGISFDVFCLVLTNTEMEVTYKAQFKLSKFPCRIYIIVLLKYTLCRYVRQIIYVPY